MRPKMDRAKEGRANPKGIPCLYAADCRDTAMSEMRSWVGSYLSCAQFLTQLNLTIVDCSTKAPAFTSARHLMADEGAKAEHVWGTINDAFATPVSPTDDLADYAPTQYLAELFRSEGYDGLQFKSTVGAGFNIVLFRHESVSLEGSRVFKATSVQYKFEEINECV